jgi:hypothetical protein
LSHVWSGGRRLRQCPIQIIAVAAAYVDVTAGADHHNFTGKRRLCTGTCWTRFHHTVTRTGVPEVVSPATMFSLSTRSLRG